ncbi:MAG: hypothetical protein UY48_C0044G0011 [Candidatus Gottesmanbacteria bacterium GW2011_GWB1_49_7]|uniref:Uncharacterized protein n=1 Tax=Candidatus Gottesmanbacteria bacterium GW2011_GWB1_49_7 TaxID=1618448 RepID=A0A0G1Y5S6_9BACT|nr:MAG: hypothetical protein UY48_C0044G0011 [Candidatus Gottesmanbacteria bacterium GW2011_GWB1_49_7]
MGICTYGDIAWQREQKTEPNPAGMPGTCARIISEQQSYADNQTQKIVEIVGTIKWGVLNSYQIATYAKMRPKITPINIGWG